MWSLVEKAPSVTRAMEEGEVREEEPPAKRARLVSEVPESAVAVERRMERGGREDVDVSQASEGAWPAPSREERRRERFRGPETRRWRAILASCGGVGRSAWGGSFSEALVERSSITLCG